MIAEHDGIERQDTAVSDPEEDSDEVQGRQSFDGDKQANGHGLHDRLNKQGVQRADPVRHVARQRQAGEHRHQQGDRKDFRRTLEQMPDIGHSRDDRRDRQRHRDAATNNADRQRHHPNNQRDAPGLHRVVISRIFRHRSGRFRGRPGPPYRFVPEKEDQAQREHRAHEQDTEQEIRLTPADQLIHLPGDGRANGSGEGLPRENCSEKARDGIKRSRPNSPAIGLRTIATRKMLQLPISSATIDARRTIYR